jgi:hypothetical protein
MAKVYFAPFSAIKYIGAKAKVFNTYLASPKPTLKKGDILIVDKVTAFNLVKKGFGEFVDVADIEFSKADVQRVDKDNEIDEAFGIVSEIAPDTLVVDEATAPVVSE